MVRVKVIQEEFECFNGIEFVLQGVGGGLFKFFFAIVIFQANQG